MSENMKLYEKVRSVPKEALKPINGGRLKGMSDINPMWRIKMLTEMFGICGIGWKVEITDKRLEKGDGVEIVCFVDINLYVKSEGEWSAAIPGMGGSSFVAQERNGTFTSDECFKMAYTDAISVACKSLGFAADVYYANDRTKYTNQQDLNTPTQPQRTAGATQTNQQPQSTDLNDDDLAALAAASNEQYGHPAQPVDSQSTGVSTKSRVYKLRDQIGMSWDELSAFAGNVLGREVKYLKSHVKTDEEWKKIEEALKVAV